MKLTLLGAHGVLYEAPRIQVMAARRGHPLHVRVIYTRTREGTALRRPWVTRVYPGTTPFAVSP